MSSVISPVCENRCSENTEVSNWRRSPVERESGGCCRCLVLFRSSQKTCCLWVLAASCEEAVRFYVTTVMRGVRFRMGSTLLELRCCGVGPQSPCQLSWNSESRRVRLMSAGSPTPFKTKPMVCSVAGQVSSRFGRRGRSRARALVRGSSVRVGFERCFR